MTIPITPASPPELCPDCQRPFARTAHQQAHEEWCLYRESPGCRSRYVERLRLELSKAQGELHEAWERGRHAGMFDYEQGNPYPKLLKGDANG